MELKDGCTDAARRHRSPQPHAHRALRRQGTPLPYTRMLSQDRPVHDYFASVLRIPRLSARKWCCSSASRCPGTAGLRPCRAAERKHSEALFPQAHSPTPDYLASMRHDFGLWHSACNCKVGTHSSAHVRLILCKAACLGPCAPWSGSELRKNETFATLTRHGRYTEP